MLEIFPTLKFSCNLYFTCCVGVLTLNFFILLAGSRGPVTSYIVVKLVFFNGLVVLEEIVDKVFFLSV